MVIIAYTFIVRYKHLLVGQNGKYLSVIYNNLQYLTVEFRFLKNK